jgi:lipid A 3-O-deacylase
MKKYLNIIAFLLLSVNCLAQNKATNYSKEISFKTENDAYLFNLNDAYYTNGLMLNYAFVKEVNGKKKIHSFELGQKIFTPLIRETKTPADIDRAYCGYLYLNYAQTRFLKKDRVLQLNGSLGLVGPASLGEGLQNTYHGWLGFAKFTGWKYQIENALVVDIGATYASNLVETNGIKIVPVIQANLGTTFTNAKFGVMMVWGAFEKNRQSALWNARLSGSEEKPKRAYEFFGYFYPQLIAQAFNATLQGGVFNNGNMQVTHTPSTLMYQQTLGVCYASGRFTGRIECIYQSKETPSQTKSHRYGSFQIAYRIH